MEDIIFRLENEANSDVWTSLIGASVAFRRDLHRKPELPWQEENTAAAIRASARGNPGERARATRGVKTHHEEV